jgi:hypothetical protein
MGRTGFWFTVWRDGMKLDDYFRGGKILVWKEAFAIVKSRRPLSGAFAAIQDGKETTVVIKESGIDSRDIIKADMGWKILTLDIIFPLDVVGVTARISNALAKANVSIFSISAYSRDHFLVKEKDLAKAEAALKGIGLAVIEK